MLPLEQRDHRLSALCSDRGACQATFYEHKLCARLDTLNCNPLVLNDCKRKWRGDGLDEAPPLYNNEHRKTVVHVHFDGFEESARME